ncbi:PREDICTED: SKP1-like protein 5 [Nelumbo nucifera]|uniref:SKP1-like protein 5 n=1 Tax=Nelumbo nucifera TaxID=4432 RepID=A0A1U8B852_NELNU|nr:PREDICTED: SKP1-like protein 5 [Nelumbo nucifera]
MVTDQQDSSEMFKQMVKDGFGVGVIPLLNVSSNILPKVIDYCRKHVEFDSKKKMDDPNEMAANYLHIKGLLDLTCQKDSSKGSAYVRKFVRDS